MKTPADITCGIAGIYQTLSTAELLNELGGTTIHPSITPLEKFELSLMDFDVGGPFA